MKPAPHGESDSESETEMHSYQMDLIAQDLREERMREAAQERLARQARQATEGTGRSWRPSFALGIAFAVARLGHAVALTDTALPRREHDSECTA